MRPPSWPGSRSSWRGRDESKRPLSRRPRAARPCALRPAAWRRGGVAAVGAEQVRVAAVGAEQVLVLLADLSGYTGYLANSEPDHAPALDGDLMETVARQPCPDFRLVKLEGDTAFLPRRLRVSWDGPRLASELAAEQGARLAQLAAALEGSRAHR